MSFVRARRLTDICTVWPLEQGQYGTTFGTPYIMPCNFISEGKEQTDTDGTKFVPISTFRLTVTAEGNKPKRGDIIGQGDHSEEASPSAVAGAHAIRKVKTGTMLVGSQDYTVYTG